MQIHEITTLSENFLKRLATDARNDAFKKATGVDWNTYKLAQTTPATAATPATATAAAPAATLAPVTPAGFNAGNVLNLPGVKQAAATVPQSPEQIRKAKQATAVQAARDQMAGKTTAVTQPAATVPSTATPTEKPGFLKTATDKIADKSKNQSGAATINPAAAPAVYRFDGRALNPQNPRDASIIKQLQAAGVTSAASGLKKSK